mmetsp:Transcript_16705/g.43159  ORF Transcript_16705/g.43159 Transcript_16705/m.43159 type:complete len:270 (-) Transcript_16705:36-845(-)
MPRLSAEREREMQGAGDIELAPMVGKAERPVPVAIAAPDERRGFVRKVYGILSAQLFVTVLLASLVVRHGRSWLLGDPAAAQAALTLSSIAALGVAVVASCCPAVMRRYPENYCLLALLTVAESVLVGFVCLRYSYGSVLLCCGLTAGIVLGLSMYALRARSDFTGSGPYLLSFMLVLCLFGLSLSAAACLGLASTAAFSVLQVVYAAGGALMASFFLVYDTQLILGGEHAHEFSLDDYAMAALCIYLDIIQLFLSLLRLFGRQEDSGL